MSRLGGSCHTRMEGARREVDGRPARALELVVVACTTTDDRQLANIDSGDRREFRDAD